METQQIEQKQQDLLKNYCPTCPRAIATNKSTAEISQIVKIDSQGKNLCRLRGYASSVETNCNE